MGWNDSYFQGPDRPVEEITWFDAVNYCNVLSNAEGLRRAYSVSEATYDGNHIIDASVGWFQNANGYRLLTESEWEFACRAGRQTAYCNGGTSECGCGSDPNLGLVGWYCADQDYQTHNVGTKNPNAWGLYDMHGNVWEWCWDWYGVYPIGPVVDPTGGSASLYRVIRGGSWNYDAQDCRSANRYGSVRAARGNDLGLRLARTAP
jgi:formylglycine-generating enzyme required for sulfatase activity